MLAFIGYICFLLTLGSFVSLMLCLFVLPCVVRALLPESRDVLK
jgi:hypothetical protein